MSDEELSAEAAANADENFEGPPSIASRTEADGLSMKITAIETFVGGEYELPEGEPILSVTVEYSNLGPETIPMPSDTSSSIQDMTYGENLTPVGTASTDDYEAGISYTLPGQLVPGTSFVAVHDFAPPADSTQLRLYLNLDSDVYAGWTFTDVETATGEVAPNPLPPFESQAVVDAPTGFDLETLEEEFASAPQADKDSVCADWNGGGQTAIIMSVPEIPADEITAFFDSVC